MGVLLGGRGRWDFGRRERSRGGREIRQHRAVQGLEPPLLRGRKIGGEREGAQLGERMAKALEALLELAGARRDGRRRWRWSRHPERIAQELTAVGLVSHAVGVQQRERLARPQTMGCHRRKYRVLLRGRERAQRVRERRADGAMCELALGGGREAPAQREPPCHPRRLALQ
jgi:hypothetical protein